VNTGQRPLRGSGCDAHVLQRVSHAIDAALADVVGVEPSPARPYAALREPLPGLGPLSVLRSAVDEYAREQYTAQMPVERIITQIRGMIRHALPSATPDWSAHLLFEEVARWVGEACGQAESDGTPRSGALARERYVGR
jgi:hypothetical protein